MENGGPGETTDLLQVTDKLYHKMLYTITATTAPNLLELVIKYKIVTLYGISTVIDSWHFISAFLYHWVDTSVGGILVRGVIIHPVANASALRDVGRT